MGGLNGGSHGAVLYRMSFDLPVMERGKLCHDLCTGLLLSDYVQDAGEVHVRARCTGSVLKSGVW
jgi:hypothetical protein